MTLEPVPDPRAASGEAAEIDRRLAARLAALRQEHAASPDAARGSGTGSSGRSSLMNERFSHNRSTVKPE
jgi:hypothetical protein